MKKILTTLIALLCFQVYASEITVFTPNGGENYQSNQPISISWQCNFSGSVKIELIFNMIPDSAGSGNYLIADSVYNNGNYKWLIPEWLPSSSTYQVKISSTQNTSSDLSDNPFTITQNNQPAPLTVTSPNGYETFFINQILPISWNSGISSNVKIELLSQIYSDTCSTDSLTTISYTIINSTPNNGYFSWTIPSEQQIGSGYRVKISTLDGNITDMSNNQFSITVQDSSTGFITLTSPLGGESFTTNQPLNITWSDNISEKVRIDLLNYAAASSNNFDSTGTYCYTIADSAESDGEFSWSIPDSLASSQKYLIRVMNIMNPEIYSISSAYFSIVREFENIENNEVRTAKLMQNYPNPFNPVTAINYELSVDNFVSLTVYNSRGEFVKTLVNGLQNAGKHSISFDGSYLNSGMYFYKLESNGKSQVNKMILCK